MEDHQYLEGSWSLSWSVVFCREGEQYGDLGRVRVDWTKRRSQPTSRNREDEPLDGQEEVLMGSDQQKTKGISKKQGVVDAAISIMGH